jgi:hypothetical protein
MEKVDGTLLKNMKQLRCSKNKDHVLGVIVREEAKLLFNEKTLRYFTSKVIIFRESIDISADIPAEIDVAGTLDGKMLSMVWICSVTGCGCPREWHPDDDVVDYLVRTYLSE